MPQQEKRFTAHEVDEQFEQSAPAVLPASATPNTHVVESLRTLYSEDMQQEQQSLERMRLRLSLAVTASQQEKLERTDARLSPVDERIRMSETRLPAHVIRPHGPWRRGLEQGLAVLLVLAIVAGWLALRYVPRSSSGSAGVFSDTNARPLGVPIATMQGNFTGVEAWSPDSHTLASLQVNTQKHELDVRMFDVVSRRTTSYAVLDSSWMPAVKVYDPFQILMGRYLLAVRAQGKNQATLEIWDITGQRAITTQIVPARIGAGGQVLAPWIASSKSEQKIAMILPDGKVTIWDVASGRKLVTCIGKIPPSLLQDIPRVEWYDHDQDLLFSNVAREGYSPVQAWDATTGARLFGPSPDPGKTYGVPVLAPDSKYLALVAGSQPSADGSFQPDMLKILDAHSGRVLHSYHLNEPGNINVNFVWLPDSQRLLLTSQQASSPGASSPYTQARITIWNVFTNQRTFVTSLPQAEFTTTTPDGQYLILGASGGRSMEIWQTRNGHKVATVATPGVYARSDSFFYSNNQQMIIGQKGHFDIWDLATGKLLYSYHGPTPFSIQGVSGSFVFWSPDEKYLTMIAGTTNSIGDGMLSIWRMP